MFRKRGIRLIFAVVTYKKFDLCFDLIQSVLDQETLPSAIFLYDNSGGGFSHYVNRKNKKLPSLVRVFTNAENEGCARVWNSALRRAFFDSPEEHVLIANDDILFQNDVVGLFQEAITHHPDELVYCPLLGVNAFSLFATRYKTLEGTVGLFDEHFRYPYFEDGDMARRIMLYGKSIQRVPDVLVSHVGSATLKSYTEEEKNFHHGRFSRNAYYMSQKWGLRDPDRWEDPDGYHTPFDEDETLEIITMTTLRNAFGQY